MLISGVVNHFLKNVVARFNRGHNGLYCFILSGGVEWGYVKS